MALLLMACAVGAGSHATPHTPAPQSSPPLLEMPHDTVAVFLAAVERGELLVLGRRVDRSMIEPERVEYVFDLRRSTASVRIYSRIKVPLPMLGQSDYQVRAVSSTLDDDGHIIESEAHIFPR